MAVTTANSVNNYASTKLCCISTNVIDADNNFKYGAKDARCCIANNFVATTYLEMLQCNDYSTKDVDAANPSKYSCFTDDDLCDIKNWLDNYCDSCTKSYAAKAVTKEL